MTLLQFFAGLDRVAQYDYQEQPRRLRELPRQTRVRPWLRGPSHQLRLGTLKSPTDEVLGCGDQIKGMPLGGG